MDEKANLNYNKIPPRSSFKDKLVISSIDHSNVNILSSSSFLRKKPSFEEDHCKTLTELSQEEENDKNELTKPLIKNMNINYPMIDGRRKLYEMKMRNEFPFHENGGSIPNFNNDLLTMKNENRNETKFNTGRWSAEEHQKFIEAMFLHGNEWKRVQMHIKTRSSTQARSHAQKFFIRLRKKFLDDSDDLYSIPNCSNSNSKIRTSDVRNERIFSWIKENVNADTIFKLAQSSGNLLNTAEITGDPSKIQLNMTGNGSNSITCLTSSTLTPFNNNFKNQPGNLLPYNSNQSTNELFFAERKDKLCKIILNLISNPNKTKRKILSKDEFTCSLGLSEENGNEWSLNSNNLNNNCGIEANNTLHEKALTPKFEFEGTECYFNKSNINPSGINNFRVSEDPNLFGEDIQMQINNSNTNTVERGLIETPKLASQITTPCNNTNSNYFNPNMNSYISIVTINLGCNNNAVKTGNETNLNNNNTPLNENLINKNVNMNDNYNNVNNINSVSNTNKYNGDNLREYINRKMTFLKSKTSVQGNNNIVSSTSHLNIVNGNMNSGVVESLNDKEKEIDKDPFKLSFEENPEIFENMPKEESDICKLNLDLDLEHFFNMDNFLN